MCTVTIQIGKTGQGIKKRSRVQSTWRHRGRDHFLDGSQMCLGKSLRGGFISFKPGSMSSPTGSVSRLVWLFRVPWNFIWISGLSFSFLQKNKKATEFFIIIAFFKHIDILILSLAIYKQGYFSNFLGLLQFLFSAVFSHFQHLSHAPPQLNLFLIILFFDAIMNEIVFLILFLDSSLLIYRNSTNFCMLILYSATLLH